MGERDDLQLVAAQPVNDIEWKAPDEHAPDVHRLCNVRHDSANGRMLLLQNVDRSPHFLKKLGSQPRPLFLIPARSAALPGPILRP